MNPPRLLSALVVLRFALCSAEAKARHTQAVLRKTQIPEQAPNGISPTFAKLFVVFVWKPVICVAFDHDNQVREVTKDILKSRNNLKECALLGRRQNLRIGSEIQIRRCARNSLPHPRWRRL